MASLAEGLADSDPVTLKQYKAKPYCRYASESTGTNITRSGTYAVLVLDGCLFLYSLLQC
jgi:hypothetical protein